MADLPAVLGLDLSTRRTGIAFPNGRTHAWDFPERWHPDQRLHILRGRLTVALRRFKPALVVAEKAIPTSTRTYGALRECRGALGDARWTAGLDDDQVVYIAPGTLKRYATGRGNADKADMVGAARGAGAEVAGDDEADAWLLRALGIAGLGGPDLLAPLGADPGHRLEVVAAHVWPVTR